MRVFPLFLLSIILLSNVVIQPAKAAEEPVADVYDIDGNGEVTPLTDGLLLLRYLFGFRGNALIDQAIGENATRTTSEQIASYITAHLAEMDIDGNGQTKPLSDGLLQLRYLFGFRGNALVEGAIGEGATRTTSTQIGVHITSAGIPTITGRLNDTGITLCADYAYNAYRDLISGHSHSGSESCANTVDSEGDPIPAGQDGHSGRDITQNDNTNGRAGFDYTKISNTGQALGASATEWSCVKDNVTGLIWEVKTDDAGLHDKDDVYQWYNTDNGTNGGGAGYAGEYNTCYGYDASESTSFCNTQAYMARVNGTSWCGASDWRIPTREELRSIIDYSIPFPEAAIDTDYFPNTVSGSNDSKLFLSASSHARYSGSVWGVYSTISKYVYSRVRLVRGRH